MKIIKVSYQKTFSIGPYLTDRVGMEADVDENDVVADVLDNLRAKADEWHKAEHPHLYQEEKYPQPFPDPNRWQHLASGQIPPMEVTFAGPPPVINIQDEKVEGEDTLALIQNAPDLDALKAFKLLASSDPTKTLYTAYCERLKQLTNG